jgi:hypothetical protein
MCCGEWEILFAHSIGGGGDRQRGSRTLVRFFGVTETSDSERNNSKQEIVNVTSDELESS